MQDTLGADHGNTTADEVIIPIGFDRQIERLLRANEQPEEIVRPQVTARREQVRYVYD